MREYRPETKETAFAAIGHFRFFVRMPAAAKRSDEHREANSAYLSESLSRAAKNRCAHRNLFHLTNAILTKARVAGQETFDFIGRPASASHFESRINRKCARLQTNVCSLFLYLCESRIPQTEPDSNESPQRMVRREFPDTECVKHKGRVNRIG